MAPKVSNLLIACVVLLSPVPSVAFDKVFDGDERMFVDIPKDWLKGHEAQRGRTHLIEFVPRGQTVTDWTDMASLTILQGMKHIPFLDFMDKNRSILAKQCGQVNLVKPKFKSENEYQVMLFGLECIDGKSFPGAPQIAVKKFEFMMFKVIKGQKHLYIVQRTWHGNEKPKDYPPTSTDAMRSWLAFLDGAELCNVASHNRTCKSLGSLSNATASALTKDGRISMPYACDYIYQLSITPDLSKPFGRQMAMSVALGPGDLGMAGDARSGTAALLLPIIGHTAKNAPVSIMMGPSAQGAKGSFKKDRDHAIRNADILKKLLIEHGVEEKRIQGRENSNCQK